MNSTIELLCNHRSIRRFKEDPVLDEHINAAVSAGQHASTSSAIQAYCALRVTESDKLAQLVDLTGGQPYIAQAGVFFMICADTRRLKIACEKAGDTFDQPLEGFLLGVIDATLFAQNMVIAFESMGYGVCYIGGLRNDLPAVDTLFDIPQGVFALFGLCVGVPDHEPTHLPRVGLGAALYHDTFPNDEQLSKMLSEYDTRYSDYLTNRGAQAKSWSETIAAKMSTPRRPYLAEYYLRKGARFD